MEDDFSSVMKNSFTGCNLVADGRMERERERVTECLSPGMQRSSVAQHSRLRAKKGGVGIASGLRDSGHNRRQQLTRSLCYVPESRDGARNVTLPDYPLVTAFRTVIICQLILIFPAPLPRGAFQVRAIEPDFAWGFEERYLMLFI